MSDALVTAALLAAVALSESVRRLPAGALVLRRHAFARWQLARTMELGTGLHLLAWCVPLTLPAVLATDAGERSPLGLRRLTRRFDARMRRVHVRMAVMRLLGMLVLVMLVTTPFAILRWGAWGLIVGLGILIMLTVNQSALAWTALRRSGVSGGAAFRSSVRFVWPFSAPQAPVVVQEHVMSGMPALLAAYHLLGEHEFLSAFRPLVYDAVHRRAAGDAAELLAEICGPRKLSDFVRTAPASHTPPEQDLPFCPRCATVYRAGVADCADCTGVALTTA